ncbi:MAG: anti-sigma factor family protein [Sedimentisphaeraceae bacterium JB056]
MKKSQEQLINDYLDGRLDASGQQQFDELCHTDADFAHEADVMRRQKQLLAADEPAAVDVVSDVLKRVGSSRDMGRNKHEFGIRRFFNVAAMTLMALALGSVLWLISKPSTQGTEGGGTKVSSNLLAQNENVPVKMGSMLYGPSHKDVKLSNGLRNYDLKFQTRQIAKTERVLGQILYDQGLLDCVSVNREAGRCVYTIECGEGDVKKIAQDIDVLWNYAGKADLKFADYSRKLNFSVSNVSSEQVLDIVNSDTVDEKIANARVASVLNHLPQVPEPKSKEILSAPGGLLALRPVLAGKSPAQIRTDKSVVVSVEFVLVD